MMNLPARGGSHVGWARVGLPLLVLCASLLFDGKDKRPIRRAYVLNAQTVLVLIDPAAGTAVNAPLANKTAQDDR